MMYYLKENGIKPHRISKQYFTIGTESCYDYTTPQSGSFILFAIRLENDIAYLVPGEKKIKLNGRLIRKETRLVPLDQIDCNDKRWVLLDDVLDPSAGNIPLAMRSLEILKHISEQMGNSQSFSENLNEALQTLLEVAGAEVGYLLVESPQSAEWKLLACAGLTGHLPPSPTPAKELISGTILNEALTTKKPVYIESMVGHPWAGQASVMDTEIFSLACFPLTLKEQVFGAVYLYTRTPGNTLAREELSSLSLLVTQVSLLLSTQTELWKIKEEKKKLERQITKSPTKLIYSEQSPMVDVVSRLKKLALSDLSILIQGETGSGKELIAREIHQKGPYRSGPFIAINCGAIPPSLMESLLFGHAKGSFTGAQKDSQGKVLQAHRGTLFLDEIGDLPLDLQVKLLRVIQEKQVEPVGSQKSIPVDFRLLSATHQSLLQLVQLKQFREDLFYRIYGAEILIPPLRSRMEDIPLLAQYFLSQIDPQKSLDPSTFEKLKTHPWPGNIRELQQVITRAAALSSSDILFPSDIELIPTIKTPFFSLEFDTRTLKEAQNIFSYHLAQRTLQQCEGNRLRAAEQLGISERTLYRLLSNDSVVTSV